MHIPFQEGDTIKDKVAVRDFLLLAVHRWEEGRQRMEDIPEAMLEEMRRQNEEIEEE